MDVKVRSWPQGLEFYAWRGVALHQLLATLLSNDDWQILAQLKPKSLEAMLVGIGYTQPCETTQAFLATHPDQVKWLLGCTRVLFKCFRDWQMQGPLTVEPTLPIMALPNGGTLRCGQPDFHGIAAAFGGRVNIEMKSGWRRIRKQAGKLARYNGGTQVLLQEQGVVEPFMGTIWLSFSDCLIEPRTGRQVPRAWPVLNYHFEPFDYGHINRLLQPRFGVTACELISLPRSYTYAEDLCA